MHRVGFAVAVPLAVAALLLAPSRTEACGAAVCEAARVAPKASESIPANAPALWVTRPFHNAGQGAHEGPITLVDGSGAEVPVTEEPGASGWVGVLLRPGAPLQPGPHVLRYEERCTGGWAETPQVREVSFEVTDAKPFPTQAPQVDAAVEVVAEHFVPTSRGSCVHAIPAAVGTLEVTPDAALQPWLPLIRWRVVAKEWRHVTAWGAGTSAGKLYAACPGADIQNESPGLPEGTHEVTVTPELLGHGELPSSTVTVTLRCEEEEEAAGCAATGIASTGLGALFLLVFNRARRQRPVISGRMAS